MRGNLQVRFLEGWAPAMAPGYSTTWVPGPTSPMRVLRTIPRPLDPRPFVDVKHESHRIRGRILFVSGLHRCKLMSVCCEQVTDNDNGVLQLRPVEPASYRESSSLIFQSVMNIRLGDGLNPLVLDPANNRPFLNNEHYAFSVCQVGAIFDLQSYVVE